MAPGRLGREDARSLGGQTPWLLLRSAVGGLLDPAHGGRLQLFPPALRGGDAVLDGLANRVVGVGHHLARALRGVLSALHRLARAELDRLAPQLVDLSATRAGRDVSTGD